MFRNKYHAKKITDGEMTFDSKKEYKRWLELKEMEKNGLIKELTRQQRFLLIHSQKGRTRNERPCHYIADFVYRIGDRWVVEDTKGMKTPEYVIKRKLMKERYDIEIQEI